MTRTLLAASLALALAAPAFAADDTAAPVAPQQVRQLDTVDVSAALDRSRNALSPDTGSSQYVIDEKAIRQLPLGESTPLNQVVLQAPGVVQDSYGGLHVRGDHANLQYRINGVIIPESIAGFGQALDARTVQNVKLLDGALPAQYGLRTAAVVDITTKSGHQLGDGGTSLVRHAQSERLAVGQQRPLELLLHRELPGKRRGCGKPHRQPQADP